MTISKNTKSRFYVEINGDVKGPFELDLIEAFMLSGHYPEVIRIKREGSEEWKSHSIRESATPPSTSSQSRPQPVRPKSPSIFSDWRLILGGIVVAFLIFKGMSNGGSKPTSRYSSSATPRPYKPTPATVLPSTSSSQSPSKYVAPRATPAETLYKGANGRTYRVPHSEYSRLSRMQSALTEQKASLDQFETQVNALESQITRDKALLDRTSQYQIDSYNQKIDRFNRANEQLKSRVDAFNSGVDTFNTELERVGTLTR